MKNNPSTINLRRAVYPGSFDPPTVGHMDIIERAALLFEELIVAVAVNTDKTPLFTVEERLQMLRESCAHLPNVRSETFQGLLVDFVHQIGARIIIRGLRAISDFEYEFQMASMNRRLREEIDTLFLMTSWEHAYLSSSLVKEVARLGGDVRGLVPPPVMPYLQKRFGG